MPEPQGELSLLPHFSITKLANIKDAFIAIIQKSGDPRAQELLNCYKAMSDQLKGVILSKALYEVIERNK